MSVVLLALLLLVAVFLVGSLVAMLARDEPFYGAAGLMVLLGPGTVLTFVYVAIGG